jgi:RHS repeat-associated protein
MMSVEPEMRMISGRGVALPEVIQRVRIWFGPALSREARSRIGDAFLSAILLLLCAVMLTMPLFAQDSTTPQDDSQLLGIRPGVTYHFGDIDSVDMESGNLTVKIPLYSLAQRGNVPLSYSLVLNTGLWMGYGAYTPIRRGHGFVPVLEGDIAFVYRGASTEDQSGIYDTTGAFHIGGNPYDGSDLYENTHPNGLQMIGSSDGITTSLVDTNGNAITRTENPTNNIYTVTDTLGRTINDDISVPPEVITGAADIGFGDWQIVNSQIDMTCSALVDASTPTHVGLTVGSLRWTVPAPNATAGNVTYLFYFTNSEDPETESLLQYVVLPGPDGQPNCATYWGFSWQADDLMQITYPTGATIAYQYASGGEYPPMEYPFFHAVVSRTLTSSAGVSGTWQYCYLTVDSTCPDTTYKGNGNFPVSAMIDPNGNETLITFGQRADIGAFLETSRTVYSGLASQSPPTVLRTTTTNYFTQGAACGIACNGAYAPPDSTRYLRQSVITTLNDAVPSPVSTTTSYTYNPIPGRWWNNGTYYPVYYSKPETTKVTGYDGSVLRVQTNSYQWENATNGSSYIAANILDPVASTSVSDGSGVAWSETDFGYDENESGVYSNVRGNQTSVKRCATIAASNACNYWVKTTKSYDANGMVTQSQDAMLNTTYYDYDSSNAFLKDIRHPKTTNGSSTVTHEEWFQFDHNSGEATAHAGENCTSLTCPQEATYQYDALGRLQQATYPNGGGQKNYTYYDTVPPSYTTDTQVSVSHSLHEETDGDLLGQPVHQINDQVVAADTVYDTFGRVTSVSNPYFTLPANGGNDSVVTDTSHGVTTGTTVTNYDALGRAYLVTRPDKSVARTNYYGPCTQLIDEAGHLRTSCTDALGRVTEVTEYGEASGPFVTDYRYDPLGNLLCVDQQGAVAGSGCDQSAGVGGTWRVRRFTYDNLSRLTQAQNPESGSINYTYDDDGNVKTKTDPDGHLITYCYDQLNRLTGKGYGSSVSCSSPATLAVRYGYDVPDPALADAVKPTVGLRTTMDDASGHTFWNYDLMGRATRVQRSVSVPGSSSPAIVYGAAYMYNYDGTVAAITYPSGRQVVYGYNNLGWNTWVLKNDAASGQTLNYVSGATYTPGGQLAEVNLGEAGGCYGGIMGEFSYNSRLQPWHTLYTTSGTPAMSEIAAGSCTTNAGDFMHRMYNFNQGQDNGNVQSVANCLDSSRNQSYVYDSLNRIESASSGYFGESYTIDPWGNLTDIASGGNLLTLEPWKVGGANNNNQLAGDASSTYTYDLAGNLKYASTPYFSAHSYSYDAENRITAVDNSSTQEYFYDGDGQRVVKNVGGGMIYWYGAGGEVLAESDMAGNLLSEYVYFNGKRLARTDSPETPATAQLRYYLTDQLGSTVMITDAYFHAVEDTDFYPYGGIAYNGGTGDSNHYKFTGKERDSETGLDDFGARYFASNMGRFMTPDSGLGQRPLDPQSWNLYAYVRNNPLNSIDPTGEYDCSADSKQCSNFRDDLQEAKAANKEAFDAGRISASEYASNAGGLAAYGSSGDHNGVNVGVSGDKNAPAGDVTNGTAGTPTAENPTGQNIQVTFNKATLSNAAAADGTGAQTVAHEGVHVRDLAAWNATGDNPAQHPSDYATEFAAYHATVGVAIGLHAMGIQQGNSISVAGATNHNQSYNLDQQIGGRWLPDSAVDNRINNMLQREYGVNPTTTNIQAWQAQSVRALHP